MTRTSIDGTFTIDFSKGCDKFVWQKDASLSAERAVQGNSEVEKALWRTCVSWPSTTSVAER